MVWGTPGFLIAVLSVLELFWSLGLRQHSAVWGADLTVNLFLLGPQCRAVIKPTGPAESLAEMKRSRRHEDILTGTEGSKASFPLQTLGLRPMSGWCWMSAEICAESVLLGTVGPSHVPPSTSLLQNARLLAST